MLAPQVWGIKCPEADMGGGGVSELGLSSFCNDLGFDIIEVTTIMSLQMLVTIHLL